jgi:hypothetical protein
MMVSIFTLPLIAKAADGSDTDLAMNRAAYQSSAINYDNVAHLATDGSRESFWQSKPEDQSWIYVDLGGLRKIDGIKLDWGALAPAACSIQVPREANSPSTWVDIAHLACAGAQTSSVEFPAIEARFVRMLTDRGSTPSGCQLNEFVIEGKSPPAPPPADRMLPPPDEEGKISLDRAGWKLQNALFISAAGEVISTPSFQDESWLHAKVPGTVLNSYLLAGAIPDPNFGDQQKLVSESFFQNDFWYRTNFAMAQISRGRHYLLNFSGINWKADIYLNGSKVGHMDGAFQRGDFDVTGKLLSGQTNILAVLVHKCPHPGPTNEKTLARMSHNGGVLGLDSPTFVASQGWNWMPSIRGRNIGIWDHVYLKETGPVILVDPFVHTTVAGDLRQADVNVEVTLKNLGDAPADTTLSGSLGDLSFSRGISLAAGETKTLKLDRNAFPQLTLINPHLWWPNGYGDQPLQHLKLTAMVNHVPSCERTITFGIRELTYDTSNGILKVSCNGQHIQLNGGNWGMDDSMLRYEARDYDVAIRLHKAMNMVMIRNWVGQVGKEEFFDACDKYGILVWDDFWLANPADGPNPQDEGMFMANVRDRILRIRNHPSLALYCGRNEGNPPESLNQGMAAETSSLDGTRYYIPNSASGLVTGHGPYEPKDDSWYFKNRGVTLHSELGLVCVPTADSMRSMMAEQDLWPINDMWGLHDFAQSRDRVYTRRINDLYGPSKSLDEFCEKAQLQNWENAKAMFEAWRSNSGSGGLAWMSHPAWPSLICQFYDYYLNPSGAYFGARLANEPLHILWDSSSNEVKVASNTSRPFENLEAEASIFNMDGVQMSHQEAQVHSVAGGTATDCFNLTFPPGLSPVYFIKLKLMSGPQSVSENFYWRGLDEHNLRALNEMQKVALTGSILKSKDHGQAGMVIHLENLTDHIALMTCVKLVKSGDPGRRILPVFYSDNYISLLPREKRDVRVEFDQTGAADNTPKVIVEGWNVQPFEIKN